MRTYWLSFSEICFTTAINLPVVTSAILQKFNHKLYTQTGVDFLNACSRSIRISKLLLKSKS